MRPVFRKAFADVRRRRLQTGVVLLVSLLSALAASMALTLLVETNAPYDRAFAAANGPHLVVAFTSSEAQVAATAHTAGVVASVGPMQVAQTEASFDVGGKGGGSLSFGVTVLGRSRPDLAVDRLAMIAGRWPTTRSGIVLSEAFAKAINGAIGERVSFDTAAGTPSLTVVGVAGSISPVADAWVLPSEVAALRPAVAAGKSHLAAGRWLMEYRVANPDDQAALTRVSRAVAAEVPPGSVASSVSWLQTRTQSDLTAAVMIPFLVAFSALGLIAAAFVIGNVVTGIVIADRRVIGIMKSVGFTPRQVSASIGLQILAPLAIGAGLGVVAGDLASVPFLQQTAAALGLPTYFSDSVLVDAGVAALLLAVALAATALPLIRAGRATAAQAIATGSGPAAAQPVRRSRLVSRLRVGAPLRLGIAEVAGKPVRAGMTAAAVFLGVATVVFAVALTFSLGMVASALDRDQQVQVTVGAGPGQDVAQLEHVVAAQPQTARYVAEGMTTVTVPGLAAPIPFTGYRGSSDWIGYVLISGRWFSAPGEVVTPSHLMDVTGLQLGQTFVASHNGESETLRLVGEIFDQENQDLLLRGRWSDVAALDPQLSVQRYEVQLKPGTDPDRYASALQQAGGPDMDARPTRSFSASSAFLLIEAVLTGLATVLAAIAAAGVLNTVVLTTRERRREIAILKAIGMDPRQVVVMVVSGVARTGLVAGLLALPLGLFMHHQILGAMGEIATNTRVPASFYSVLGTLPLLGLACAGAVIAAAGAWLPAQWAALERISGALQVE
ncbi:MAG TPA: ABC transporter permease [Candidatus Dormibacteraeota bacterium]